MYKCISAFLLVLMLITVTPSLADDASGGDADTGGGNASSSESEPSTSAADISFQGDEGGPSDAGEPGGDVGDDNTDGESE